MKALVSASQEKAEDLRLRDIKLASQKAALQAETDLKFAQEEAADNVKQRIMVKKRKKKVHNRFKAVAMRVRFLLKFGADFNNLPPPDQNAFAKGYNADKDPNNKEEFEEYEEEVEVVVPKAKLLAQEKLKKRVEERIRRRGEAAARIWMSLRQQ